MTTRVTCPGCKSTFNVADHLAGRRGGCPKCERMLTIPEASSDPTGPDDGFELLDEGYELDDPGAPDDAIGDAIVGQARAGSSSASSSDGRTSTDFSTGRTDATDPRAPRRLASAYDPDEDAAKPRWKHPLFNVNGTDITPVGVLLVLLPLIGLIAWWQLGPGPAVKVLASQPVHVVTALNTGAIQQPYSIGTGTGNRALGMKGAPAGSGAAPVGTHVYSVGKRDQLFVTKPDPDGDHVLLKVSLKQAVINAHGSTKGYDSTLKPDEFELRKRGTAPGSGTPARLVRNDFTQPVRIDLGGANTSSPDAARPPHKPDDELVEKNRGAITATYDYVFGATRGQLVVNARHAWNDIPGSTGLFANGTLTTTHPDNGPRVTADYRGGEVEVSWDPDSEGHWATERWTFNSHLSPFTRHDFGLVFERPPHAGKYVLSYAGKDLTTVKLPRMKQPSAPVPSPVASNRPHGPQPQSKTASGVGAYFDVVRDAKGRAQGLVSANSMRQIGIALQIYRDQNRQRFPDTLVDLLDVMPGLEASMANPRTGDNPGFIYEKPDPGQPDARTPVLWESYQGQKDLGGAILYGDGSIR